MAKKPPNAGILFERDLIKLARKAGMVALKLSTPTPPPMPCPKCHTPVRTSSFTTRRPFDVLLTKSLFRTDVVDRSGPHFHPLRNNHSIVALECKSSGAQSRLALGRIEGHQIKGLLEHHAKGWITGLAIDLPKPKSETDREWWFVPAPAIEQLLAICAAKERKSLTWVELKESGAVQISQAPDSFSVAFGV